jgi:uridine kinase/Gpi18-like mannosyltransferase
MKTVSMGNIKGTKRNRYIIIVCLIAVKMVIMGLFSSDYQDTMFIPFVRTFLSGVNPYEYFYQNGLPGSFPYFPYMLFIESVGGLLLKLFSPTGIFFQNFLFKIPLLMFDVVGFIVLRKMGIRFKYATILYFCSPVIIFGTYVHGQLDIIPTVFLLIAVYFLVSWRKKYNLVAYAVFLGIAIGCKFHIMAAVPILFFYLAKKKNYVTSLMYHLLSAVVVLLPCIFFSGDGFFYTVLLNKEQSALTTVSMDYGSVSLAIPILVLMIVYLKAYELNYFNKNLLISMLGMLFTVFLICLSPMPAWYIWAVPFYVIYFGFVTEDKYKVLAVYGVFNILYLIYFIFLHKTGYADIIFMGKSLQYLKIDNSTLKSCVFATMVAFLAILVYDIYRFGIASNNLYRRRGNSFVIGIAGDSGSGKSRLLEKIQHLFGTSKDILFIEGDGDHRWKRGDENWEQYTALDPQANYLYRQAENIRNLKRGNHVLRHDYSHETGKFTEQKRVEAKKYIVMCGLHSLYLPILRDELDLKIFMDTDSTLRNYWKIQRDVEKRGYSKEEIVAQIEKRIPDAQKYIYPQRQFADLVITYFDKTLTSCYEDNHEIELSVKFEMNISMDVEYLLESFRRFGVNPQHYICDDFSHQVIVFDGNEICGDIDFAGIAEDNIPQYEDFFTYYPNWGTDVEGVIQVMLLFMISEKMKG